VSPLSALARRAFADARVRTMSFALLFFFGAYAQTAGYRAAAPTLADRMEFARNFGDNKAVRLLYGEPHDLLTVGGYVGWRIPGLLAVFAAVWGLLGAVRALRAEEDSGRAEILLAGPVSRRTNFAAAVLAILAGTAVLWLALFVALVVGKLAVDGSAFLALAAVSAVPVFAGVGAVTSQLAPSKRVATGLATGVLAVTFAIRVVADTGSGTAWLRWATPLGWIEEMRPFADPRPWVLILPALLSVALFAVAAAIMVRRDVGTGLLRSHDTVPPRLGLLGSPTALALRDERGGLLAWLVGAGAFAALFGVISDSVASGLTENVREELERFGAGSVTSAEGFIGFGFEFFILAVCLFMCAQVSAARHEEAEQRLETLLALPVSRRGWLVGRLALAVAGAAVIGLVAGVLSWAGAASQGADVSLANLIGAGANTLPPALLFLGLGALAFALVPRAATGIAYGLVGTAFIWELFGSLVEAPDWVRSLSPFHNVGLVPSEPFEAVAAVVMLALAAVACVAAVVVFGRRDLAGS
jgi:polyether ionophore transport system permease protein